MTELITETLRETIREGNHPNLSGDISGLRGYISRGLSGYISGLSGYISSGLRGDISSGLSGDISGLRGDISGLRGYISSGLRGDILDGKYPDLSFILPDAGEIQRLDEVREIVINKPERLKMEVWHTEQWTPEHTPEEEHSCGSAHCIAGWLQALSPDPEIREMEASEAGCRLAPASSYMFYTDNNTALSWLKDRVYAKHMEVSA